MRSIRPRAAQALALVAVLLVGSCTSVQTTKPGVIGVDREQRMSVLVSEEELAAGAASAYAKVLTAAKQEGNLNSDPRQVARIRRIAQQIIPEVDAFRPEAERWNWEVNLIESDQLNAWVMPGGKIAFYSGIIEKLNLTDPEIAAIMGHEIAHALREHARERASEQQLANAASLAIGIGGSLLGVGDWSQAAQIAYGTTFGLKHSREHEIEADRIGVELSARAGYDPRAAISVWQKMSKLTGGKSGPEWLSTHPSNESRIEDLKVYSQKVMPLYRSAS